MLGTHMPVCYMPAIQMLASQMSVCYMPTSQMPVCYYCTCLLVNWRADTMHCDVILYIHMYCLLLLYLPASQLESRYRAL